MNCHEIALRHLLTQHNRPNILSKNMNRWCLTELYSLQTQTFKNRVHELIQVQSYVIATVDIFLGKEFMCIIDKIKLRRTDCCKLNGYSVMDCIEFSGMFITFENNFPKLFLLLYYCASFVLNALWLDERSPEV